MLKITTGIQYLVNLLNFLMLEFLVMSRILFLTQGEKRSGPGTWKNGLAVYLLKNSHQVIEVNTASIKSFTKLRTLLNADVVHGYHARGTTVLFLGIARLIGKKTIYTVHGRLVEEKVTKKGLKKIVWLPIHSLCFYLSNVITFPSKFLLDDTLQNYPAIDKKAYIIRNGIKLTPQQKNKRKIEANKPINLLSRFTLSTSSPLFTIWV